MPTPAPAPAPAPTVRDVLAKYTSRTAAALSVTGEVSEEDQKRAQAVVAFLQSRIGRPFKAGVDGNPQGVEEGDEGYDTPEMWAEFSTASIGLDDLIDLYHHFKLEREAVLVGSSKLGMGASLFRVTVQLT